MIDVANEARVSQTTVSLDADGARLSRETRERVIEAAARLGYQPGRRVGPPAAASAASTGFVCDEISTDPWTAIGLDGVREKAWEHGLTECDSPSPPRACPGIAGEGSRAERAAG